MSHSRHPLPFVSVVVLAAVALVGCADESPTNAALRPAAQLAVSGDRAATTVRRTFSVPAPPAPVGAACLEMDDLRLAGTWNGWAQIAETSTGHLHVTEYIDYSAVTVTGTESGLTWTAAPGAHENLIFNVPVTADDLGDSGYTITHEFHARFLGPEGLPDLLVEHSVHRVLGPDLELKRNEFVPFSAECIGDA